MAVDRTAGCKIVCERAKGEPVDMRGVSVFVRYGFGCPETPSEQARRVFQTYDPEDNGFIPDSLLEDVMKTLDLISDPEYINLMKNKLDPEGLGIILLGPFLQEFFPDQGSSGPESFTVYHYNGLKQSNYNEKVMYVEGTAVIMGFEDPMLQTDDTPI
ncbi:Protein FAM188A [Myotis davidii]|uniref:Ubiquitin carboxyl-terminal hydrolase MINDY-3 n=1 Tax=Myotis davidii TaxID=225400 RepID=L5LY27_MYODS|nr:Protein FAM188A [Myotis davidii]